jgi:RNA polymerase sigma-70 factor (ECF subfamily)
VFRAEYGRAVAVLARVFGSIDLAEEAVQDAFAIAVARWPATGVPPSPAGWIITTARNRAIDRLRREGSREERHAIATQLYGASTWTEPDAPALADDQLRLIFTCCHPALSPAVRVALTLRLIGGLTTAEIARAFLTPEVTMAQRLVRAKGKIRDAGIPYRVPDTDELPSRVSSVLTVIYLIFNEGYAASSGDRLVREDLCAEAIRLGRLVCELLPEQDETRGLLALMLLVDARRPARLDASGALVLLPRQDRRLWNAAMLEEGRALVRQCLRRNRPGPYQIQAAINAVHSDTQDSADTDWRQIVELYDLLMAVAPSPVVALNRAVAIAELDGPEPALALVDALDLSSFYLFHAIRADLLRRLGRTADARAAYQSAVGCTLNAASRAFLERTAQTMTEA